MLDSGSQVAFQTTRWSLIDGLRGDEASQRRAAEAITSLYWPAVYAWLRRHGTRAEEAAERTQAFFAEVVVGRRLFERAERGQGRLRSLVLASLRKFLVDGHRREVVRGKGQTATLETAWADGEPGSDERDPDAAFHRRWATATVREALRRCERHFEATGKPGHWRAFEARVVDPAIRAIQPPPLAQSLAELGFASPPLAAAAVQTVKRRFEAILREVVAETVAESSADEVKQELADLRAALGA